MAIMPVLANQLLPLTVALSGIALAVGLAACPMQSLRLQHAFVLLSAATLVGILASFTRHKVRRSPYKRRVRLEFGIIPLALFWGFLLLTPEIPQVREGSARTQMTNDGKQIGLGMHSFYEMNKYLPTDIRDAADTPVLSCA